MKKSQKGSIGITVLISVLFFTAVLVLLYASNTNKVQSITEKIDFIRSIYEKNVNNTDEVYQREIAKKKRKVTKIVEDISVIKLTGTAEGKISNYKIQGSSEGVGDLIEDTLDSNYRKYKIPIKLGKNYINESNFLKGYGVTINENEDYYEVTTNTNTAGIYWEIDGNFKVGDKINAQAKVLFTSSEDQTINDSVTLRIRNITKGIWIHTGRNGKETDFSTITIGEEKTLKFSEVELTSDNYTEGDIIAFNISRGLGTAEAERNTITFNVYKDTIFVEKDNDTEADSDTNSQTYSIYLDSPLLEGDYIDFKAGKVIRNDGTEETINLPQFYTYEDYTKIEILTETVPSKIEVEYTGYVL